MYVLIVAKYRCINEYTEKWTEFVKCDDYDELSSDSNKLAEHIGFDEIDEECDGWMVSHREDRLIGCSIQRFTSTQYFILRKLDI